jgi:hypothetical protein
MIDNDNIAHSFAAMCAANETSLCSHVRSATHTVSLHVCRRRAASVGRARRPTTLPINAPAPTSVGQWSRSDHVTSYLTTHLTIDSLFGTAEKGRHERGCA